MAEWKLISLPLLWLLLLVKNYSSKNARGAAGNWLAGWSGQTKYAAQKEKGLFVLFSSVFPHVVGCTVLNTEVNIASLFSIVILQAVSNTWLSELKKESAKSNILQRWFSEKGCFARVCFFKLSAALCLGGQWVQRVEDFAWGISGILLTD